LVSTSSPPISTELCPGWDDRKSTVKSFVTGTGRLCGVAPLSTTNACVFGSNASRTSRSAPSAASRDCCTAFQNTASGVAGLSLSISAPPVTSTAAINPISAIARRISSKVNPRARTRSAGRRDNPSVPQAVTR